MTVAVLGAGAMGSLFGGLLARGGPDVLLVDIWKDHVAAISRNGLRMIGDDAERTVQVKATVDAAALKPVDVVLVQCKAAVTGDAVREAMSLFGDQTVAVSFQNGLGNEENIADVVGSERVLGGTTAQAAVIEAP